mmetsp:Transcript_7464/g.10585  ORF Transcript_7464/g.10585 Transcript_7464/m.10585 type:complete len:212 (-) Transcript_7464:142-777(-)
MHGSLDWPIEKLADGADIHVAHHGGILRTLQHFSLILLRLLVRNLALLREDLFLTLYLRHLFFEMLLFLHESLLFGQGHSASGLRIALILNFLLFLGKFGLQARFFELLSLSLGLACPLNFLHLEHLELLDLPLLLKVLLIPGLLGLILSLNLLPLGVFSQTLLGKSLFLLAHLLNALNSRLLLHGDSEGLLVAAPVQNLRRRHLLRLQKT